MQIIAACVNNPHGYPNKHNDKLHVLYSVVEWRKITTYRINAVSVNTYGLNESGLLARVGGF